MRIAIAALFLLTCCQPNSDAPSRSANWSSQPAFWVWNTKANAQQSISDNHPLYWQIYEFPSGSTPTLTPLASAADLDRYGNCTPVIRLPAGGQTIDDLNYLDAVIRVTNEWYGDTTNRRLQIDYDCPSSRLADYAALLQRLRQELSIDHLSATALASWIDAPDFHKFSKSADQLVPMFYDLEADRPNEITDGAPRPMTDTSTIHWIKKWKTCRTEWLAGLPNFQRLTLFDSKGQLIGHLQQWDYASVNSSEMFRRVSSPSQDCTVFEVTTDNKLFNVAMESGSLLVWRTTNDEQLTHALQAARDANASGTVWFAHPESAPVPARSITHLESLQKDITPTPELVESFDEEGAVTLSNRGTGDLLPNKDGTPHSLVVEAGLSQRFQDTGAGSFHSFSIEGGSPSNPQFVHSITLYYYALPAGTSLKSRNHLIARP